MAHYLSFYREMGSRCDVAVTDRELVVNCAGQYATNDPLSANRPLGRHDYYLIYCTSGGMRIRVAGEEGYIRPGDMVIIPPGEGYYYNFSGNGELYYYWTHFTGNIAEEILRRAGLSVDQLIPVGLDDSLAAAFRHLMNSFVLLDDWQEAEAAGRLLSLLAALGRAAANHPLRVAIKPVRRSLEHMESERSQHITVADLAAMEFMSVSHYSALFRSCTGFSPKEYLIHLRMRSAMDKLIHTNMSIAQISREVGYDDPHYFSRLFKKYMGLTPRAARDGNAPQAPIQKDQVKMLALSSRNVHSSY